MKFKCDINQTFKNIESVRSMKNPQKKIFVNWWQVTCQAPKWNNKDIDILQNKFLLNLMNLIENKILFFFDEKH